MSEDLKDILKKMDNEFDFEEIEIIPTKTKNKKKRDKNLRVLVQSCKSTQLFCDKCIIKIGLGTRILVFMYSGSKTHTLCKKCGLNWLLKVKTRLNQ